MDTFCFKDVQIRRCIACTLRPDTSVHLLLSISLLALLYPPVTLPNMMGEILMETSGFNSEGSVETSSTVVMTTMITVTPTPSHSSAQSNDNTLAITIPVVVVVSLILVVTVVVVMVVVVMVVKTSKPEIYAR